MDIAPVGTITVPRTCGEVPCGQCQPCHHRAMLHMAAHALRTSERKEEDDPKGILLDLLDKLGLPG